MRVTEPESFEVISALLKAGFRRDAVTNNFLSEADYRRGLAERSLLLGQWDGGFAFFSRRDGFFRMSFTLLPPQKEPPALPEGPVVTEIPSRPGSEAGKAAADFWACQGFAPLLRRVRLRLEPGAEPETGDGFQVREAEEKEKTAVVEFLRRNFDPLTGCIPKEAELSQVFCLWDGGTLAGVLHTGQAPGRREIRHLAVETNLRGTGAAKALLGAYLRACPAKKHLVWTGEENAAALKFYKKHGFRPDGWTAGVLYRKG